MTHLIQIIDWVSNITMLLPMLGCVAVWKPKGVQIARKYLQNCFANNKEGAGFAYYKNGKIEMHKGFFSFDEFYEAYKGLQKYAALIHFRIATHGKVDADNCHPFMLANGKYALVHNGVLPSSLHSNKKEESDSRQFGELIAPLLDMIPWENADFGKVVGEAIGYNKVAIMRNDGKVWLFNEGKGEWHKGAWFSNRTYAYGAVKRAWSNACETTNEMWQRLGYGSGSRPNIVYSTVHRTNGFYDAGGEWHSCGVGFYQNGYYNLQGDWVSYNLADKSGEQEYTLTDEEEAELEHLRCLQEEGNAEPDTNWESEPSDEELAALAEVPSLEALEGDLEFMPETEQEKHVKRWLAIQEAKSIKFLEEHKRKQEKPVYTVKIVDGGFPDWEHGANAVPC